MRYLFQLVFILLGSALNAQSDRSYMTVKVVFELIDGDKIEMRESFEGGGKRYSYPVVAKEPIAHIDSLLVWEDGAFDVLKDISTKEGGTLDLRVVQEVDSMWFFYGKEKQPLYFHSSLHSSYSVYPIVFSKKKYSQIRVGMINYPVEYNKNHYYIIRNFEKSLDDKVWNDLVTAWSKRYSNRVYSLSNYTAEITLDNLSSTEKQTILNALVADPNVAFLSISLNEAYNQNQTYFNSKQVTVGTNKSLEETKAIAKKHGFEYLEGQGTYQLDYYVYKKSKILDLAFVKDYHRLISALGGTYGAPNLYHEVRLD